VNRKRGSARGTTNADGRQLQERKRGALRRGQGQKKCLSKKGKREGGKRGGRATLIGQGRGEKI